MATVRLNDGSLHRAELHWYEATGIGRREFKIKQIIDRTLMKTRRFAICIDNTDYPAALELRKIYEVLSDRKAEQFGQIRVIDESGDDYLYASASFVAIELPKSVLDAITRAA